MVRRLRNAMMRSSIVAVALGCLFMLSHLSGEVLSAENRRNFDGNQYDEEMMKNQNKLERIINDLERKKVERQVDVKWTKVDVKKTNNAPSLDLYNQENILYLAGFITFLYVV